MKRFAFLISLLSSIFLVEIKCQVYGWTNIGSNLPNTISTATISDIAVVGDSMWITSGYGTYLNQVPGEIYFSADGGQTFSIQSTLYGTSTIKMIDSKRGYCAGAEGQVYKTTDGGGVWTKIGSISETIKGIDFPPNSDTGYLCGNNGAIKRITPSGIQSMQSGTSNEIKSITAPSREAVFAAWWQSVLFYDGNIWTNQQSTFNAPGIPVYLNSIFMITDSTGWVGGSRGLIAKTTTAGWSSETYDGWNQQNVSSTDWFVMKIRFADSNNGIAVGTGGYFYKTNNSGQTWIRQAEGLTTNMLTSAWVVNETEAYVIGNNKTLLKYMLLNGDEDHLMTPSAITVVPNPASDIIKVAGYIGEAHIYDMKGKFVWKGNVDENSEINISFLEPSVYLIVLGSGNYKLIKQ